MKYTLQVWDEASRAIEVDDGDKYVTCTCEKCGLIGVVRVFDESEPYHHQQIVEHMMSAHSRNQHPAGVSFEYRPAPSKEV